MFHLTGVSKAQVWNRDKSIVAPIPPPEAAADSLSGGAFLRIIAVVQNHQLHIAENGLARVVIRTAFWQTDPVEV